MEFYFHFLTHIVVLVEVIIIDTHDAKTSILYAD